MYNQDTWPTRMSFIRPVQASSEQEEHLPSQRFNRHTLRVSEAVDWNQVHHVRKVGMKTSFRPTYFIKCILTVFVKKLRLKIRKWRDGGFWYSTPWRQLWKPWCFLRNVPLWTNTRGVPSMEENGRWEGWTFKKLYPTDQDKTPVNTLTNPFLFLGIYAPDSIFF